MLSPENRMFFSINADAYTYGYPVTVKQSENDPDRFTIQLGLSVLTVHYDVLQSLGTQIEFVLREKWDNARPDTTDPDGDFSDLAQLAEKDTSTWSLDE